jgi:hypothetical protein
MKVQKIDMAQFVLHKNLIGNKRLNPNQYIADGYFIQELLRKRVNNSILIQEFVLITILLNLKRLILYQGFY